MSTYYTNIVNLILFYEIMEYKPTESAYICTIVCLYIVIIHQSMILKGWVEVDVIFYSLGIYFKVGYMV